MALKEVFNIFKYIFLALFSVVMISTADVYAVKSEKIDICHYDNDTEQYKRLRVSMNGWINGHMKNHPMDAPAGEGKFDDDCNIIPDVKVFARVYRENGNNSEYDADVDQLYVSIVDTNGNEIFDEGDTLKIEAIPGDFSANPELIDVGETEFEVAEVIEADTNRLNFHATTSATTSFFVLSIEDILEDFEGIGINKSLNLRDRFVNDNPDQISIRTHPDPAPQDRFLTNLDPTNGKWVEVRITL